MQADSIKVLFTYVIATMLILGGLLFLFLTRLDPEDSSSATLIPLVAGFIGAAIQFVFNRETSTSTSRMVERATAAGVASQPTMTATSGPPASVTSTPTPSEVKP